MQARKEMWVQSWKILRSLHKLVVAWQTQTISCFLWSKHKNLRKSSHNIITYNKNHMSCIVRFRKGKWILAKLLIPWTNEDTVWKASKFCEKTPLIVILLHQINIKYKRFKTETNRKVKLYRSLEKHLIRHFWIK
mgnify:CR=1 FL=1